MNYEATIIRALQRGVTAAVAASTSPTLSVKYLDVAHTKPDSGKWLEVVHIPNNRMGDFWGGEQNYQGMLRLVLHWPNDGTGIYVPVTLLASITGYFFKGRVLSGVQVSDIPDYMGAEREGDETLYPASVRYRSYRT